MWPNRTLIDLLGIDLPIVQAPMAGASGVAMAVATGNAGGLGSLPCAMLDADAVCAQIAEFRQHSSRPVNVNFFCHDPAHSAAGQQAAWLSQLRPYYSELGLDLPAPGASKARAPFGEQLCELVEECKPEVVSFHFGLPEVSLLNRVKAAQCRVMSSATTVAEARWLESHGCDVIIAQGYEAGGHRGMFLTDTLWSQVGTLALVPQVVDAVSVPVIAAGGIADGRGIAAAFALGAAAVQIGTAYLFTPESLISPLHRAALHTARDDQTALTNVFSGRPARSVMNRIMRELGPMSALAPVFPTAGGALAPLKQTAEAAGASDFSSLWSGQAATLGRELAAAELTRKLADEALQRLGSLASSS